ncbi:uncharacterized protein F5891DRAFT_1196979 [Suillus fuscotomentosus]|uniref:Uncharacterized protein n=1 Tax=Suillus fuscotomentosus TaxID=1912939 RepID=A0AAD4HEY8_9AGAM|nr:uncharacterized protein F5891DRAFT_1196979 [Suillus fuscotomentosus]KAG1893009.1 hypothetical protein F5891DRAFT_1196979 [Suillus fuscotomentosus]
MLSATISTLSPPAHNFECSLREGSSNVIPSKHEHLLRIIYAGHDLERQMYILSLDGIDVNDTEQDKLFTMYSIDTVHSSYLAAQSRVRQYTQFVAILQHSECAWAQRIQEMGHGVPEPNTGRMSVDGIKEQVDEQDILLARTIETVFANYAAAQDRVRQYTQFLTILKSEEDAWAERFQEASSVMPGYEPVRCDHPRKGDLIKPLL